MESIGVRFRGKGKIIFYNNVNNLEIKKGDFVIVETEQGEEYGEVLAIRKLNGDIKVDNKANFIKRVANNKDKKIYDKNLEKEKEAFNTTLKKIKEYNIDMKLISAEYLFDGSKLLFFFSSEGRVDFRELVKDLASIFKTRIELRQIGVRDEIKKIGGNGICGRELCCCTFLNYFDTVSIKAAKEQNIALNPTKISGMCGRLMCCLKYEQEVYQDKLAKLPKTGTKVQTEDGEGIVDNLDILKEDVRIKFKDGEGFFYKKYNVKDIRW